MPFIAQGKTNLTYILIIVILAVIVGGGILGYQYLLAPKEEVAMPEGKLPEVKAPAEGAQEVPPAELPKVTAKEWVLVLETTEGFVKLSKDGFSEPIMMSDLKTDGIGFSFVFQSTLLPSGKIAFSGILNVPNAKENTIYTWPIDNSNPKVFFELDDEIIMTFAISPDETKIAVVSIREAEETLSEEELLQFYQDLSEEEVLEVLGKEFEKAAKEGQEQMSTIKIYDVRSKPPQISQIIKWPLGGVSRLIWKKTGLFAMDNTNFIVFDPETGQELIRMKGSRFTTKFGFLFPPFSPDGSKYFNLGSPYGKPSRNIWSIPDGSLIGKVPRAGIQVTVAEELAQLIDRQKEEVFAFSGMVISFSPDSQKLLVLDVNLSKRQFVIWEFDITTASAQKLTDSRIMYHYYITQLSDPVRMPHDFWEFQFITLDPNTDELIFALRTHESWKNPNIVEIFRFKRGQSDVELLQSYKSISFFDWYLSTP